MAPMIKLIAESHTKWFAFSLMRSWFLTWDAVTQLLKKCISRSKNYIKIFEWGWELRWKFTCHLETTVRTTNELFQMFFDIWQTTVRQRESRWFQIKILSLRNKLKCILLFHLFRQTILTLLLIQLICTWDLIITVPTITCNSEKIVTDWSKALKYQ